MNMRDVKTLHRDLFKAIESGNTKESLSIIDGIISCQDPHSDKPTGSLLDKYPHCYEWPLSPLIHSIVKQNATVARNLLEKGCDPDISNSDLAFKYSNYNSPCPEFIVATKLNYEFLFKLIGKPHFDVVVMKILEGTNAVIADRNANTILHVICRNKMTSWLEKILHLSSHRQLHYHYHSNIHGHLPMHVAAECNFLEYFDLVFKQSLVVRSNQCDCNEGFGDIFRNHDKFVKDISIQSCRFSGLVKKTSANKIDNLQPIVQQKKGDEDVDNSKSSLSSKMEKCELDDVTKSGVGCMDEYCIDLDTPVLDNGTTVLHIAAEQRNYKLVKLLVENGADVSALNARYHSPLCVCFYSIKRGEVDSDFINVCRALVMAGSEVNGYCHDKKYSRKGIVKTKRVVHVVTLLHVAADLGSKAVLELLLSKGADPKVVSKDFGKIPIQIALEHCHMECVQVLMNQSLYPKGFFMSFVDSQYNSLLHSASECDEKTVNELVVNCSSFLDKPNQFDVFPLDKAVFYGNIPFINAILTCRPEVVNICQWQQFKTRPPLHLAASSPLTPLPLCQILLSYGADIYAKAYNKKNMAYRTALRSDCHHNAVFLCEQMSRPFAIEDKEELLEYGEQRMDSELVLRLRHRLNNVPSLMSHSLDAVRQALIGNCHSFKNASSLPIPDKMVMALKYRDANPYFH